jgi:hypothetical protein
MAEEKTSQEGQEAELEFGGELGEGMEGLVDEVLTGKEGAGSEEEVEEETRSGEASSQTPEDLGEEEEASSTEEEIQTPENLNAEQGKAFKTMRERLEAASARITELEENAGTNSEEYKTLQQQNKEMSDALEKQNLAASPRFKSQYLQPMNNVSSQILEIGKEYEMAEADLKAAASMGRKERIEFLREKAPDQNAVLELAPLYQRYSELAQAATTALENHKTTQAEMQKQQDSESDKMLSENFDTTLKELQKTYALLRESKANPDWLPNIVAAAKGLVNGDAEPKQIIEAALKSRATDGYRGLAIKYKKERDEANGKLAAIRGSSPDIGGEGRPKSKDGGGSSGDDLEHITDMEGLADLVTSGIGS